MSVHKSLKLGNKLVRRRNVLKRVERIVALSKGNKWQEGENSVFSLPKIFIDKSGLVQVNREKKTPAMVTPKGAGSEEKS